MFDFFLYNAYAYTLLNDERYQVLIWYDLDEESPIFFFMISFNCENIAQFLFPDCFIGLLTQANSQKPRHKICLLWGQ